MVQISIINVCFSELLSIVSIKTEREGVDSEEQYGEVDNSLHDYILSSSSFTDTGR